MRSQSVHREISAPWNPFESYSKWISKGGMLRTLPGIETADPFGHNWDLISLNIREHAMEREEFPLTTMSKAVAAELWKTPPPTEVEDGARGRALDVGTGTGVHALLMATLGYAHIEAIDSSEEAIKYAKERAELLLPKLLPKQGAETKGHRDVGGADYPNLVFRHMSLDHLMSADATTYSLIAFNPPAYYDLVGCGTNSPAAEGVYVDDQPASFEKSEASFLYRFFARSILPRLAPYGHAICSWPALEKRVSERTGDDEKGSRLTSPMELLRDWFGIRIIGNVPNARDFYNREAILESDYGLGPSFWQNFWEGYKKGLYSSSVCLGNQPNGAPSFRFGILHLVRLPGDGKSFLLLSSSTSKQG